MLLGALLLARAPAHASGFLLHDQSAGALARGGAAAADSDEPAAVWFNPACLGWQASAGAALSGALAWPRVSLRHAGGRTDSEERLRPVPSLFLHLPLRLPAAASEWTGGRPLQLGLGIYAPFGFALDWPRGWVGAQVAESIYLAAIAVNPVVAVPLGRHVTLAGGVSLLRGQVELAAALPADPTLPDAGGRGELRGGGWGASATAALAARVPIAGDPDRVRLGLVYRGGARLPITGQADFSGSDPRLDSIYRDQAARAALPLPELWTAAAALRLADVWRLALQLDRAGWSRFERLEIRFTEPTTPTVRIERAGRDAWSLRAGVTRQLRPSAVAAVPPRRAVALAALRAGLRFDQATAGARSLSPAAPDADRVGLSAGLSLAGPGIDADLGYLFLYFLPVEAAPGGAGPAGTYRAHAHVLSLTLRWAGPARHATTAPAAGP